jgi:hypothetical protein
MELGFNYPWPANRYITIGPNTAPRNAPQPWTRDGRMAANLRRLKDAGISVVRIWLMGDGNNYDGEVEFGFSKDRGLFWDSRPPGRVHPAFVTDFTTLLDIFADAKMRIIPVLVDFAFFDDPNPAGLGGGVRTPHPGVVKTDLDYSRGKRSIAENPAHLKTFVEGTLNPLLDVAAARKDVIYAFDVFNEPYWCVGRITGSLFGRRMDTNVVAGFLKACVGAVRAHGLPATIGHRYYGDITGTFKDVPADRPQFHYYDKRPYDDLPNLTVPPVAQQIKEAGGRKPFLGEFGSVTELEIERLRADPRAGQPDERARRDFLAQVGKLEVSARRWNRLGGTDALPEKILPERLRLLAHYGYELAMIWPGLMETPDDDLTLGPRQLASITGRRF